MQKAKIFCDSAPVAGEVPAFQIFCSPYITEQMKSRKPLFFFEFKNRRKNFEIQVQMFLFQKISFIIFLLVTEQHFCKFLDYLIILAFNTQQYIDNKQTEHTAEVPNSYVQQLAYSQMKNLSRLALFHSVNIANCFKKLAEAVHTRIRNLFV